MWFWFALLTMLFWGGSDLFSKLGSPTTEKYSHWRMVIVVGLVMGVMSVILLLTPGNWADAPYDPMDIIRYLPVSGMYILSMIFGYVGLRYIELSYSSPICNSSGAIASVLCVLFLGERLALPQIAAIVAIGVGIILLGLFQRQTDVEVLHSAGESVSRKYTKSAIAILFPILYCLIDGLGTFLDSFYLDRVMSEATVNVSYGFTFLIVGLCALVYMKVLKKVPIRPKKQGVKLLGALCETAGQAAYVPALAGNPAVAAPMICSYSMVSVLLSRIFLKERLRVREYLVIALVVAGIVVLGLYDA